MIETARVSPYLSVITRNVKGLNSPIEVTKRFKKSKTMLPTRNSLQSQRHAQSEEWECIFHVNTIKIKVELVTRIKVDFKIKIIKKI